MWCTFESFYKPISDGDEDYHNHRMLIMVKMTKLAILVMMMRMRIALMHLWKLFQTEIGRRPQWIYWKGCTPTKTTLHFTCTADLCTYVCTFVTAYLCTYAPMYLCNSLPMYFCTCLPNRKNTHFTALNCTYKLAALGSGKIRSRCSNTHRV